METKPEVVVVIVIVYDRSCRASPSSLAKRRKVVVSFFVVEWVPHTR